MKERVRVGLSKAVIVLGLVLLVGSAVYDLAAPGQVLTLVTVTLGMFAVVFGHEIQQSVIVTMVENNKWLTVYGTRIGGVLLLLGLVGAWLGIQRTTLATGAWGIAVVFVGFLLISFTIFLRQHQNHETTNGY